MPFSHLVSIARVCQFKQLLIDWKGKSHQAILDLSSLRKRRSPKKKRLKKKIKKVAKRVIKKKKHQRLLKCQRHNMKFWSNLDSARTRFQSFRKLNIGWNISLLRVKMIWKSSAFALIGEGHSLQLVKIHYLLVVVEVEVVAVVDHQEDRYRFLNWINILFTKHLCHYLLH